VSPKETVIALYAAFGSGNAKRISDLLHESVVWVAPPGNATQVALGLGVSEDAGAPNGSNNLSKSQIVGGHRSSAKMNPNPFWTSSNSSRIFKPNAKAWP
jgi:hypothetical protein